MVRLLRPIYLAAIFFIVTNIAWSTEDVSSQSWGTYSPSDYDTDDRQTSYIEKNGGNTGQGGDSTTITYGDKNYFSLQQVVKNELPFRATRTVYDHQKFVDDNFDIVFYIEDIGNRSELGVKNITVDFDKSNAFKYIKINDNDSIDKKIPINNSTFINVTIKFTRTGSISLPKIRIDGAYYPFEDTVITVDRPTTRYFNYISLFLTGIGALSVFFFKELYLDIDYKKRNLLNGISYALRKLRRMDKIDCICWALIIAAILFVILVCIPFCLDFIIRFLIDPL
jgi:hypothetical protein